MKSLGGFFDKFRNKVTGEIQNRTQIIEIIKKYIGQELKMDDITISSGILRIKTSSIAKNEIFIKKNQILKELSQKLNSMKIVDIR